MDMVFKSGQTELVTRATGKMIRQTAKESFSTVMGTFSKVSGNETWSTGTENTRISTVLNMTGSGNTIFSMGWAMKYGMMARNIRGIIIKGKNQEKAYTHGKMGLGIMENGTEIAYMARDSIPGLTAETIREAGKTAAWMARVFTAGATAEGMKARTLLARSMARAFTLGQMADSTMVNGYMESSMEEVSMLPEKGL